MSLANRKRRRSRIKRPTAKTASQGTRVASGGAPRAVVASRNITGRKRTEDALREREEHLRLAATAAGFGAYTYDLVSGASYWSPELKALVGVPTDQPLPLDKDKLFTGLHPEDQAGFLAAITAANDPRGDGLFRCEFRVIPPQGKVRWLQVRGRVSFAGEGAACRAVQSAGVVFDITKQKQAEAMLQLSHQLLSLHVEQTPLAVIEFDVNGRVRQWNRAAIETFGYSREEAMGRHWSFIVPGAIHGQLDGIWTAIVGQRGGKRSTNNNVTKDGRTISCEWTTTLLVDQGGRTIGVASLIQDITDRMQAEGELLKSREQMRILAARLQAVREEERTNLAREMHDVLAQELTRLKIDLVWLENRLVTSAHGTIPGALAARVAEMTQVTDTAIQCVQQIATGLRPAVLDSLGLCAAVEWQAKDCEARSEIACRVSVPVQEPPVSREVATATFRILQESLTNVLRHAYATRVDVSLRQKGDQLVLQVSDNGCGIRPKALSNPMSIGLAGMRERALLLGGELEVQSQPGSGTKIHMRLPLLPAGERREPAS